MNFYEFSLSENLRHKLRNYILCIWKKNVFFCFRNLLNQWFWWFWIVSAESIKYWYWFWAYFLTENLVLVVVLLIPNFFFHELIIFFFRDINDKESVSYTLRESLFDVMRVYINLVHDYNETCKYTYFYYFPTLLKIKFGWTPPDSVRFKR